MNKRTRLVPEDRKTAILTAAIKLARKTGYRTVSREAVSKAAKVSSGLVSYYFNNVPSLHKAILKEAIEREDLTIIGQAIVLKDPLARKASPEVRSAAIRDLL